VYQLLETATLPSFTALEFTPKESYLTLNDLSGPGVMALGETYSDAKYQLLQLEEMLNGG
jgi:hypothetical protein